MSKPWEAYAVEPRQPVGVVEALDDEGNVIASTADDDPAAPEAPEIDEPVGELPAAAPGAVADQPWAEYGTSAPEEPGLEGSVTADADSPTVDEAGNLINPDGSPVEAREPEQVGSPEAVWEGVKGGALMGWGDEIQGFGGGVGSLISGRGFSSGYQQERDAARQRSDDAWDTNPWAYGAGYVPGTLMSAIATRGRGRFAAPEGASLMTRMGYGAGEGAVQGAITGAGHADDGGMDTLMGGVTGGAFGAPLGALAVPLSDLIGNVAGRAYRAVAPRRNNLNSGLDALAQRAPQNGPAMRAEADRLIASGVPARITDVVDESGRGVIRDAAGKMTPARDEVVRHADDVYVSMQDRVAQQAQRISDAPQTARQMQREIAGDDVAGTQGSRGEAMGEAMAPVRNEPVPLNDEVKAIFATREGMAALRGAEGLMTDPADRAVVRQVMAASRAATKQADAPPVDPDINYAKNVPGWKDMPEKTKQLIREQAPDMAVPAAADPWDGVQLTVDMADKIARAMKGRAAKTPGLERVARDFGNAIRGTARDANEGYAAALDDYSAASGVADAAGGTGKFDDSKFLSTPPDSYATAVQAAGREPVGGVVASGRTTIEPRPDGSIGVSMVDEAGQTVRGALRISDDGATAQVIGVVGEPNTLGPAQLRTAIRDLQVQYPGLRAIEGARNSGAGAGRQQRIEVGPLNRGLSEADAMRARARDEVVDRATSGGGQNAPATARQLARGSAQNERSEALLGPEGAGRLREGMDAEVTRLDNTRFIEPRTGSQTQSRGQDAVVDGFANAVANTTTGGKWAVIHTAARWLKQGGIKGIDAERLARDAISEDPLRVGEAIRYLEQKGMKRARAEKFVNTYAAALAGRAAGKTQDEEP